MTSTQSPRRKRNYATYGLAAAGTLGGLLAARKLGGGALRFVRRTNQRNAIRQLSNLAGNRTSLLNPPRRASRLRSGLSRVRSAFRFRRNNNPTALTQSGVRMGR